VAEATKTMNSSQALLWGVEQLKEISENPNLDAELLLRHVLGASRVDLYASPERVLDDTELEEFRQLVARREQREPVQYLTGLQNFRALELRVGPGVLIPRPETEMVVERALELIRYDQDPLVADMGVGSGAIALSIAKERPDSTVWGVDKSASALEWAMRNRRRGQAFNVNFVQSDLFEAVPPALKEKFDLIVANPPYLSLAELAQAAFEVRFFEPETATVAGPTGLEVASRLVNESRGWLRPGGWLVLETWPGQAERLRLLMIARYAEVHLHSDLSGATRIAEGRRPL
jgi:release factor glutamine methyltransferase